MELSNTNWQIITGAPSVGKSSTLSGIAFRGYKTIPEAARVLIDEEISKGKTVQEIRSSELKFQERVLEMKLKIEHQLSPNELVFFDRGIWDSIPYMSLAGATEERLKAISCKWNYKNIFFLEQVSFKKDYARIEDEEKATLIGELLFKAYSDKGYNVIKVPVMSISNRVDFILKSIEH